MTAAAVALRHPVVAMPWTHNMDCACGDCM